MFCSVGLDLYEQYQTAKEERSALNAHEIAPGCDGALPRKTLHQAKQRYVLHFANWLSHKAFCQECKPKAPSKGEYRSVEPGR